MVNIGEMFFVNQQFVRCADIQDGMAWLQLIDLDGVIRISTAPVSALVPLRDFLMPRSLWPQSGDLDLVEVEREQRQAQAERKAKKRAARQASRKARRSHKIERAA